MKANFQQEGKEEVDRQFLRTIVGTQLGLSDFRGFSPTKAWKTSLRRIFIGGKK
ncbi:hypothetical protein E2C01_006062 [Portunus trituberculatus]|uniref:Uncharacterized protein n=1 Tax=Portunus trituberculatus TaxID=210409 RepID=A0A5B7CWV6_PORTR|nr:hypothetical protein [Portunus trituberculatus]